MAYYNPYFGNYSNYNQNYQQTQNGLVPIPSEDMARVSPVAHGASVTFRDENRPYIYIKTLGREVQTGQGGHTEGRNGACYRKGGGFTCLCDKERIWGAT